MSCADLSIQLSQLIEKFLNLKTEVERLKEAVSSRDLRLADLESALQAQTDRVLALETSAPVASADAGALEGHSPSSLANAHSAMRAKLSTDAVTAALDITGLGRAIAAALTSSSAIDETGADEATVVGENVQRSMADAALSSSTPSSVVGTGEPVDFHIAPVSTPPAAHGVFVLERIHENTADRSVRALVYDVESNLHDFCRLRNGRDGSKTFRVVVDEADAGAMLDPSRWPAGLHVRRWIKKPPKIRSSLPEQRNSSRSKLRVEDRKQRYPERRQRDQRRNQPFREDAAAAHQDAQRAARRTYAVAGGQGQWRPRSNGKPTNSGGYDTADYLRPDRRGDQRTTYSKQGRSTNFDSFDDRQRHHHRGV